MDILTLELNRVRLNGTVLFHYELSRPWSVELPQFPDAVFHYLRSGSAIATLADGRTVPMAAGDFVLITRGESHVLCSDSRMKPFPLLDLDRRPAHLGSIRHGGGREPVSRMVCGYFGLSGRPRGGVLDLLPPILHWKPATDLDWLETILQRMVDEAAAQRPGQLAALSRMTEMVFVEMLRSWIRSLGPGQSGWLGAMSDPHIGKALQLIHERPELPWTVGDLGRQAGLGRSAFAARFTMLVGQPVHRYLVARRMKEAAILLDSSDESIAQIASRVGYATTTAFSKVFRQYCGVSPGRYRELENADEES